MCTTSFTVSHGVIPTATHLKRLASLLDAEPMLALRQFLGTPFV